jgi:hypothetical protein
MPRYQDVTNNETLKNFYRMVPELFINSTELNLNGIKSDVNIFPSYYFNGSLMNGKVRGAHKQPNTPEKIFRKYRIFFHPNGWRYRCSRGIYYLICVHDGKLTIREFVKLYLVTAALMRHQIRIDQSLIPAAGNGVFALKKMPTGTVLGEYQGKILSHDESLKYTSDKMMHIHRRPIWWPSYERFRKSVVIDGACGGNWTAMINDYRGSGKEANAEFNYSGLFYTIKDIEVGEEIYIDYGEKYWNYCKKSTELNGITN